MDNSKKYLLGTLVVIIIGYNVYDYFATKKEVRITKLTVESETSNRKCPLKVDEYTTLDSTTVTKEPVSLNYFYSVTVDKDSIEDLDGIKTKSIQSNQFNLDNNDKMQWLRNEEIALNFHYKDWKGEPLFSFTIKPSTQQ